MSESQWDEAARNASNDIFNSPNLEVLPTVEATPKKMKDDMSEIIAKHFAQLRETYGKLVELAVLGDYFLGESFVRYSKEAERFNELLNDPLIKAEIDSKGGE